MKKITSISNLERFLSKRLMFISMPPLMESLFKKVTNDRIVLVPTKFNSKDELENYSKEVRSKKEGIILGRGYAIDLIRGKVKLGEGSTTLSGNVLIFGYKKALKILDKHKVSDKVKVLEYSSLPFDNCVTYVPSLIAEAIRLQERGKLNDQIKVLNKFKLLLYKKPTSKDPIDALKESYRGTNLREDWEKLTPKWKEVIHYYLDSSLGLLPGESERALENLSDYSSGYDLELSSPKYPEFVDLLDLSLRNLLNGKNVYVIGSLRSGKSTFASLLAKRFEELGFKAKIVDYHGISQGYKYIEKLAEELNDKEPLIGVLTYDLYRVIRPKKGLMIKPGSRVIFSLTERKDLAVKIDKGVYDVPLSFLLTLENVDFDDYFFDYMFNVIFDADPNKVLWYLPLLKLAKDYGLPIPRMLGKISLEINGRKLDNDKDLILKWFSVVNRDIKIKISEEYGTDLIDTIDVNKIKKVLEEEIIKVLKPENSLSLIELYYYSLMDFDFLQVPNIGELRDYLISGKRVNRIVKEILEELLPNLIENSSQRVEEICMSLRTRISTFKNISQIDKEKINEIIEDTLLAPYKLVSEIKLVLSSKQSPSDCVETAIQITVSAVKGGRTEWVKSVIPDLIKRAKENTVFARLFSVIAYYYLMNEEDERLEEEIERLQDAYSIFPKSLIKYKRGELAHLEVQDPLWATILFGSLADYALSSKDLIKFAFLYEKFRRLATKVKEIPLNKDEALLLSDFLMTIPTTNSSLIYKELALLKKRLDAGIGYTLLLTHPKTESVRTTIELVEKLSNDWFSEVWKRVKEGDYTDEDCMDLIKMYQLKLMKSLANGEKYEYKTILQDVMDLKNICNQVKSSDIKGAIDIITNLSGVILNDRQEELIISGTSLDLAIYIGSLILLGRKDKQYFFNIIAKQIEERHPPDSLEVLLVQLIDALINEDKKRLEQKIEKMKDNYYSAMLEVLVKVLTDKRRAVLGLIPYISMWHITGSRPRGLLY